MVAWKCLEVLFCLAANKEAVYKCQGLNTLLHALSKAVDEEKDVENIICYTTALDAAIMDSRKSLICSYQAVADPEGDQIRPWPSLSSLAIDFLFLQ